MNFYQKPKFRITKIALLSIVGLILSVGASAIATVWSPFIKSFISNDALVGVTAAILTAISFLSSFFVIPILEKANKAKVYYYSLVGVIISYILFSLVKNFFFFLAIAVARTIIGVFQFGSFGVMIRDESKLKDIGKSEGLRYTLLNIGYLIGPLIAGFVAARFGIRFLFVISASITLVAFLLFSRIKIKKVKTIPTSDYNIFKNLKSFFSSPPRTKAYLMKFGIAIWWSILFIFLPLLIIRKGLGMEWIGIAIFGITLPLLFLEYPLSRLADSKGYKKFFFIGFLILAFASLAVFFSSSIYLILITFVLSSIGAAFVEPLAEAYFFKVVPQTQESKYYAPFLTSLDLGKTVGTGIASAVIVLFSFNHIFLFLCFEMLFFAFLALTLRH